jgi:sugar/nucleoside kinase (ribokinase family)
MPADAVFDLLVVGDCNPDLLLCGGDVVPEFGQREKLVETGALVIGGSAAIAACGAARLGLRTAFVGVVGDDLLGRFMLAALTARGIDVSGCVTDPALATGITVALVRGDDRAILTAPGAIPALTAPQVGRGLLRSARHVHIASYHLLDGLRPGLPGLVADAHAARLTVSLDPQGDPGGGDTAALARLAHEVDVLFVNEQEDAGLDTRGCPLVVVKRGANGALARWATGVVEQAAIPVDAVDATGAGDSFDAGFLAAWLAGQPLAAALALGCACGALSTRALGGTAAQPTRAEARAALR